MAHLKVNLNTSIINVIAHACFILAVDHVVATINLARELSLNFSVREIVNMFCQKCIIISSKDTIKAAMKIMRTA